MEYSRYGKTRQGIQRYRCKKCGRIYVVSDGKNLDSSKLTAFELLDFAKCIYLDLSVKSCCIMTGLSPKAVILWQKRAFSIATAWIDKAKFSGKTWIDEVYFHFANGKGTSKEEDECRKSGLSFSNVCVCIGYDEYGTMFCRVMKPINDYSALLVDEMRKHPGTKASALDDRLCFISYKAWLNSKY